MTNYISHSIKAVELILFYLPTVSGLVFWIAMGKGHLFQLDFLIFTILAIMALGSLLWLAFKWKGLTFSSIPTLVVLGIIVGHILFIVELSVGLGKYISGVELLIILWISGGSAVLYSWFLLLKMYISQKGVHDSLHQNI